MIVKIAGGEAIVLGEVELRAREVAVAPVMVGVLTGRKFRENIEVVFALDGFVKPGLALPERPGEGETGSGVVDVKAAAILERGNEIGGEEAEVVVAHSGFEIQHASGTPAVGGGIAAGENFDGAYGVCADAKVESAADGLADVETIEGVESLIAGGAGDVDLALSGVIGQNAGQEWQGVADVARGGIRSLDNLLRGQSLGGRGLSWVDRGRRISHLHGFFVLLLVRKSDIDRFRLTHLYGGIQLGVEAFFFHRNRISAGGEAGEFSAAGEVAGSLEGSLRTGRGERHAGVRNREASFVLD